MEKRYEDDILTISVWFNFDTLYVYVSSVSVSSLFSSNLNNIEKFASDYKNKCSKKFYNFTKVSHRKLPII